MASKKKLVLISILGLFLLAGAGFSIYVADYYPADNEAIAALNSNEKYEVINSDNSITFNPRASNSSRGVIFYPGGKVEAEAYSVMAAGLAENGHATIIAKMPFNLAFFGANRADDIIEDHPEISSWVMMGHSLGGVFASDYAVNNPDKIEGVIYLAAYPSLDAYPTSLKGLSLRGSEDGLTTAQDLEDNKSKFPANTSFMVIEGGNHYQFGNYGIQQGDNNATITREEQQKQALEFILEFLKSL
ncbi:alpha/beta hydrolase [Methanobacterium movens]|nr:alpha/beta hydrolase [Methanobacterium alkalithermotolerans]